MLFGFYDRLQRILPFADTVIEEIVCEDTEVLEEIILQLFDVMQRVANFSCGYVKRGRFGRRSSFQDWQTLRIAVRMVDGLVYSKEKKRIDEMDGELTKIVNDFTRAVDVETLRLAKKSGTHSLFQSGDGAFSVVSRRARRAAWVA